jgi:CDP-diglyceride synthetase
MLKRCRIFQEVINRTYVMFLSYILSSVHQYIYIYIYIYVCVCVCVFVAPSAFTSEKCSYNCPSEFLSFCGIYMLLSINYTPQHRQEAKASHSTCHALYSSAVFMTYSKNRWNAMDSKYMLFPVHFQ